MKIFLQWFAWWQRRGVAQMCGVLWFCSVSGWGSISALTCGCVAITGSRPFLYVHVFGFQASDNFWEFWGIKQHFLIAKNCPQVFCLSLFGFFPAASNVWWEHRAYNCVVERDWTSFVVMELLCHSTVSHVDILSYCPWFQQDFGLSWAICHLPDLEDVQPLKWPFHAGSVLGLIVNIDASVSAWVLHPALMVAKRNETDVRNEAELSDAWPCLLHMVGHHAACEQCPWRVPKTHVLAKFNVSSVITYPNLFFSSGTWKSTGFCNSRGPGLSVWKDPGEAASQQWFLPICCADTTGSCMVLR